MSKEAATVRDGETFAHELERLNREELGYALDELLLLLLVVETLGRQAIGKGKARRGFLRAARGAAWRIPRLGDDLFEPGRTTADRGHAARFL